MHPILKEIKRLLLLPSNNSSSLPLNTSVPSINSEIQNADNVFVVIEYVEILENEIINDNNHHQNTRSKIDLNQPLNTKGILNKEIYLPTPRESHASSPVPSETTFSTIIYQPRLFAIFESDQPRSSDEVEEYLKEDKIKFSQDPFEWWANKKSKYSILSRLARIYLAIPATSTSSGPAYF
ncbi:unnamed protein product [Rhizophagus irregularis]|nr:unnamed protein product [Rhizophagus irregularis]